MASTEYSLGRSKICWNMASAIRSLITILPSGITPPVAEGPLGVLHNVPFMHQGDRVMTIGNGMLNSLAHKPLGTKLGDGLDADS